jgi:hypothetical protein
MIQEVLYDIDNVMKAELQFFSIAKSSMNYIRSLWYRYWNNKDILGEEKGRITIRAVILYFRLPIIDESLNQSLKTKEDDNDKQLGI